MQRRTRGLAWVVGMALGMAATPVRAQAPFSCKLSRTIAITDLSHPQGVIMADVANDKGVDDIVVVDEENGAIKIFPNGGDGSFQTAISLEELSSAPVAVQAKSLRNDGRNDLIFADPDDSVVCTLLHGAAVGSFDGPVCYELDDDPVSLAVVDMDRDGFPDIAALGDSTVSILHNLGDGNFVDFASTPLETDGGGGNAIAAVLLNNDNRPDLVTVNSDTGDFSVFIATGDGTFNPVTTMEIGDTPIDVATGDYDEDGNQDIAVANQDEAVDNVHICLGNGTGDLDCSGPTTDGETRPNGLVSGQLDTKDDEPGSLDMVVTDMEQGTMTFLLGSGTGEFTKPRPNCFIFGTSTQEAVALGNANNDHLTDVVVALSTASGAQLRVLFNTTGSEPTPAPTTTGSPGPTFTPTPTPPLAGSPTPSATRTSTRTATPTSTPTVTPTPIPTAAFGLCDLKVPGQPIGVTTGDFDGDSRFDVVVADGSDTAVRLLINTAALISVPNCLAHTATTIRIPVGLQPKALVAADFDADGNLDLAVTGRTPGTDGVDSVVVLYGNGSGSFSEQVTLPLSTQAVTDPRAIIASDVDGEAGQPDGIPDVVIANEGTADLSIVRGRRRNRSLGPVKSVPVGRAASALATGDFNHDGRSDLAAGSDRAGDVSILLQDASAANGFRSAGSFGRGASVAAVVTDRFDANGLLDLAVTRNPCAASPVNGTVDIYSGGELPGNEPVFDPAGQYTVRRCPQAWIAGDFNADARPDVVVANTDDDTLSFLFGSGADAFLVSLPFAVGAAPVGLAAAFIDDDGSLDVVVANEGRESGTGSVSLLLSSRPPPTPTPTLTWTPTITPTAVPTETPSRTPSFTRTLTPSLTPTRTPSNTASATPTSTPSLTPTRTLTGTITLTPPITATFTPTKVGVLVLGPGCEVSARGGPGTAWPIGGAVILALVRSIRRRTRQ